MSIAETFQQITAPLGYFASPGYRIFWGYLLLSVPLALGVLYRQKRSWKKVWRFASHKKYWRHASVLTDVQWIFFNNILWLFLLAPFFGTQIAVALQVKYGLDAVFGFDSANFIQLSLLQASIFYTICLFVVDDFSRFVVHMAYHKIPLLWRFHAVHHSAEVLTPLTLYRVHYLEMFINASRSILVAGFVGGVFIYCVDGKIQPLQLLGANIFSLLFNIAGANLRHSHIRLEFGRLERFILSPAQHQLHHSSRPEHFDKNFGVMIALWDKLFGSWVASKGEPITGFGLGYPVKQSLLTQLLGHKEGSG